MDNLTHSLFGALIGQAGLKKKTGLGMAALVIGANIPDIDATCTIYGMESIAMRRGITHGPLAMILLPLLLAGGLWWFDRWQAKRGKRPEGRLPVRFGWLYALALIGCLSHPALDWLNTYGVRLLEPFSSRWFYGDAIFIIDLWLWLGMGFAVWFSLRREKRGRNWWRPARLALAGVIAYMLANIAISASAATSASFREPYPEVAMASPVPLAPWRREILFGRPNDWQRQQWSVFSGPGAIEAVTAQPCAWPDVDRLTADRPDLAAFLFWSRMPFVERHEEGIAFGDARYSDEMARDRFNVTVPGAACE